MDLPVPPPQLPCPLTAGWEVIHQETLPRRDPEGRPQGGFSAAAINRQADELWLLSDAPLGHLRRWRGLNRLGQDPLRPLPALPLRGGEQRSLPESIDGEGLVLEGQRVWVASEGRRSRERPAALYAFDRGTGRLLATLPLPPDWQPAPARGLRSNGGPESLALLRRSGHPDALLLAAEMPLLQDPGPTVRLAMLTLPALTPATTGPSASSSAAALSPPPRRPAAGTSTPEWIPLPSLLLPGAGWGLTDLSPLPVKRTGEVSLLALWRRFAPPDRWQGRLALYSLAIPDVAGAAGRWETQEPVRASISWDLLAPGLLPADNWEAITVGPDLPDGRPSLLVASDDNFNPFQDNHLVQLAPRREPGCPPTP
jgi:hypothetical protein